MKFGVATKLLLAALAAGTMPAITAQNCTIVLPEITEVMELAFPTWNVDKKGKRVEGGGKWNPNYLTKRWNGLDPALGGYPTPIDTRYPFEFAAAFKGESDDTYVSPLIACSHSFLDHRMSLNDS